MKMTNAQQIDVQLEGASIAVKDGEKIHGIFKRCLPRGKGRGIPLAAKLNQQVVSLDTPITYPCSLSPLFNGDREGTAVYRLSACLLLYQAVMELYPSVKVVVGQSLAGGYYYDFQNEHHLLPDALPAIEERMRQIVAEKRPYLHSVTSSQEACRRFTEGGYEDKVKLLNTTRWFDVHLVECGGYLDIRHGAFVPHTGYIDQFALVSTPPGFILQFPETDSPIEIANKSTDQSLFQIHLDTKAWNRILGVTNVGTLNEACLSGEIGEVIKIA
jgi:uridine kinase